MKKDILKWFKRSKYNRVFLSTQRKFTDFPDLLDLQKRWFEQFTSHYLKELFKQIVPIEYVAWDQKFTVDINEIDVEKPILTTEEARKKEMNYSGIIIWRTKLIDNNTWEILFDKKVNIGMLPIITENGSYIINGVERVIVSQIIKSFGIFFSKNEKIFTTSFKIVPKVWVWTEVTIEKRGYITMRIDRSRKFPITALLRVFGIESDDAINKYFAGVVGAKDIDYIAYTLWKDKTTNKDEAALFIYNKIRPGENIDAESAINYIKWLFLNPERMNLGSIVLRKINSKLNLEKEYDKAEDNLLTIDIMIEAIKYLIKLWNEKRWYFEDDIDYLSNRRIRTLWEVLYNHLLPVIRRFSKSVKGKLSVLDLEKPLKLTSIANFKMIDSAIKSFFATSQLSQFLDQTNPLAELEHKRRLTALWPGGIKRETATFEVRDVHLSHYGRICPIETPEWQNIGLVLHQALYSRINEDWFVEVPAVKVFKDVAPKADELVNRIAEFDIMDKKKVLVKDGEMITKSVAKKIEIAYKWKKDRIKVRPFLSEEIEYISPESDEKYIIADVTAPMDEYKNILQKRLPGRHYYNMEMYYVNDITHLDVDPSCIFSANTSLIPFVDHNDPTRANMGTNMQRQAIPLLKGESNLVGTGLEWDVAERTHSLVLAEDDGEVLYVDWKRIKVKYKKLWIKEYKLIVFQKSNQKTSINQIPKVSLWQKIKKGDILYEGPSVVDWELALGKNLNVAFMSYDWFNYEDAIIINRRLVQDDELTTVHIADFEIEVSDTKLWPEITTNDIPSVSLSKLKNLDEDGIIRIGTYVEWKDVLIGKITPKGEWELTPEEKLVQAIFGDKSKSVKDTSLYLPSWTSGKVVDVVVLDSSEGTNLSANIIKKIKVYVASTRKVEVWDKMAGRHGNKGIVSKIVNEEDMPFTADWKTIDIVLNPLGVVSRMNIGQVMESQLWLVAKALWEKFAVPLFSHFEAKDLKVLLKKAWLPEDGKQLLYDGKTWYPYPNKVTVWYMHIIRLVHMVEDKIHARAVWPYSLITQQPLWGKAHNGGQRFGEMEVWALEAYGAVNTLQEILTVKSDDVLWRNKAYESIIKGEDIKISGLPESFNLLVYELKGLWQEIKFLDQNELDRIHAERQEKIKKLALKWISA